MMYDEWFESIRQYMQLIQNTQIYTSNLGEDVTVLMNQLGFSESQYQWYDGVCISGVRDGIKYASAWCVNMHSSDHPDSNFSVGIYEYGTFNTKQYRDEFVKDEYKYKYRGENGEIDYFYDIEDPELLAFQIKLLQYCETLNNEDYVYFPRIMRN